ALARDAVEPALGDELVDSLPDGHAGQPVPRAQFALRRDRGVDGQFRALDEVQQDRAELEVLRYWAVRVDGRHEGSSTAGAGSTGFIGLGWVCRCLSFRAYSRGLYWSRPD